MCLLFLNVWSRTWGDGCTANQRFPHGRCQLGVKDSDVHLVAVLFVHRQQQVIKNFCHGFQARSPWLGRSWKLGWLKFQLKQLQQLQPTISKKMIKFNVLCLGIWINNCNATSVRPSKGSRNLSSAKPMYLQGNLRPHGNHAANRVFRNTIRSISLRSQVVCVSCWNKSEWETMGNNEKNSLKR